MPELPRGTVTFLLSDLEGSTELLKALGADRYHDLLADHYTLMTAAIADAGGRVIDTQGDAFFAAFTRARDAVAAAVAAQRAHATHAWPPGAEMRVRMGLDTGEPTVGADRYVGLGIHRTARIMAAGHGGQVLLSGTTSNLVHDDLPPEITLKSLGEQRLKDLDRPVHIFQLETADLPTVFPPLRTLDAAASERHGRRRLVVGAIGVAVAAAAALTVVLVTQRGGDGITVGPNSVGVIDPNTNSVVGQIPVGIRPGGIDAGGGSVWVTNGEDQTLSRIDANRRAVVRTIPLGATPTDVAEDERAVWVAEGLSGTITRVDPQFNAVTETIPNLAGAVRVSGGDAGTVAVGDGSVWAAFGSSAVVRINPLTNAVAASGYAGRSPSDIAYGEGAAWIANHEGNTVSRFSPATTRAVSTISVGQGPSGVTVGGGAVWVTDEEDNALSRIDPGSNSATSIPVGRAPRGVAYGEGAVWVANADDGTVSRVDPNSGTVIETIHVGGKPVGIAVGDGFVWVTVQAT